MPLAVKQKEHLDSDDRILVANLKRAVIDNFSPQNNPPDHTIMMETLDVIHSRLLKDEYDHPLLRGVQEAMAKLPIHDFTPKHIAVHLANELDCNPWNGL